MLVTAEATRLERALTQPLETDNLDEDLSLEPALEPNNIGRASGGTKPTPKIRPTPKEKQPAKRKSPSKTTTEGMRSQNFVSWSCSILD